MLKIRSRRDMSGDIVEIRIMCGSEGKAVMRLMHTFLVKINRRLMKSGGSGISYELQLKEENTNSRRAALVYKVGEPGKPGRMVWTSEFLEERIPNLVAEMVKRGYNLPDLHRVLKRANMAYTAAAIGSLHLPLEDAQAVRDELFPECSLEYLFGKRNWE